jgi:YfiH family protein
VNDSTFLIIDDKYKFIEFEEGDARIYFSTAHNALDFNKNSAEGIRNLENLKKWFSLEEVGYLNQTHSDIVHVFDKKVHDGDAILTDKKGVAIGVFTADCVPILIYDKGKQVISAVHSGWKSTYKCIIINTITKMIKEYNTRVEDLSVYIGPHNMKCCYEFGEDLIEKFKKQEIYKDIIISDDRKISMKACITTQLKSLGINEKQIYSVDVCTQCSKDMYLHSYRKEKEYSGRMFSFLFIK